MFRYLKLGAIVVAIATITAFVATKQSVVRLGPFYTSTISFDTATGGQAGGHVNYYKNGVDTLIVGDVVYLSANNTVRKSTTLASYNTIVGVVVGGTSTSMQAVTSQPTSTDTAAKAATHQVIVLDQGRAWVRIDAAAGIAPGLLLQPSATVAGKVMAKASTIDSLQRALGRLIDSGVVSTQVLAHISIK